MNRSEEFVSDLCTKSFLSLWSYSNPRMKDSPKELCDVLVVCDPDVIIFSVKEIGLKEGGDPTVDVARWRRKAVESSIKQIYGAERHLKFMTDVVTKEGKIGVTLPLVPNRQVHRVAVALGSKGKVPVSFEDFGKGFIHVFDEVSLPNIMIELDTITDFVTYLKDKETLYSRSLSENSLLKSSLPTFAYVSHFGGPPVTEIGPILAFVSHFCRRKIQNAYFSDRLLAE